MCVCSHVITCKQCFLHGICFPGSWKNKASLPNASTWNYHCKLTFFYENRKWTCEEHWLFWNWKQIFFCAMKAFKSSGDLLSWGKHSNHKIPPIGRVMPLGDGTHVTQLIFWPSPSFPRFLPGRYFWGLWKKWKLLSWPKDKEMLLHYDLWQHFMSFLVQCLENGLGSSPKSPDFPWLRHAALDNENRRKTSGYLTLFTSCSLKPSLQGL